MANATEDTALPRCYGPGPHSDDIRGRASAPKRDPKTKKAVYTANTICSACAEALDVDTAPLQWPPPRDVQAPRP